MSTPAPLSRRAHPAWLLLLVVAAIELVGSMVVRARVPSDTSWREAADHIAGAWADGDQVTVVPRWADPLLREWLGQSLGERLTLDVAGPAGIEGAQRLWVVSLRGHRSSLVPAREPDAVVTFGHVRVERHDLGTERVLFDFVGELRAATATQGTRSCTWTAGHAGGRGLGEGPVLDRDRLSCGGSDDRAIAETVIEDLAFEPRHCISHRPSVGEPIGLTFADVELGERLVLHAGVPWVNERHRDGTVITLTVRAGETRLGEAVHTDGDGWASYAIAIPAELRGTRQALTFEVTSPSVGHPFCWTGRSLASGSPPTGEAAR